MKQATPDSAVTWLLGIRDGTFAKPPIYERLGIDIVDARVGSVELAITSTAYLQNPHGQIAGGALAALLDTTLAWACDTCCPSGHCCTTLEIKTNFLRPLLPSDGRVIARGTSVFTGSRILVAQGDIMGHDSRIHAIATTTCLVVAKQAR
jgi:uncharacterized protein (TIGR00369 family)